MKLPKIYDISPTLSSRTGVFPGDTKFERDVALDFSKGHNILLSSIKSTLHIGAHADAPSHYVQDGRGIDQVGFEPYLGNCLILHAQVPQGARVEKKHLSEAYRQISKWPARRILVRTNSFPDPNNWNSDFCSLHPDLIDEWAADGAILVGIDTPSVDPETSKDLPSHAAVARGKLAILEGVCLGDVPEGLYTLIALPLKIEDGDAGPVRAILLDGSADGSSDGSADSSRGPETRLGFD